MEEKFADINKLKENIRQILSMYEDQRQSTHNLEIEKQRLSDEIEKKNEQIEMLKNEIEVLKTAKTISVSEEDKEEVKRKINKLVREIDKSIGLLNE